jgi:hypothetical protein
MQPDLSLLVVAALIFIAGILERIFDGRHRREQAVWVEAAAKTEGVVSRVKNGRTILVGHRATRG